MTEFPIIYSAPMILARKEGRKWQTRRIVTFGNSTVLGYRCRKIWAKIDLASRETYKDEGPDPFGGNDYEYLHAKVRNEDDGVFYRVRPRVSVGDRLFVRETHTITGYKKPPARFQPVYRLDGYYNADNEAFRTYLTHLESERFRYRRRMTGKIPPIFCYRSLSRSIDEVTGLRVQRVQDISEEDAKAEGVEPADSFDYSLTARDQAKMREGPGHKYWNGYMLLWETLHGKGSWARNDWVWVTAFKPISPPKNRRGRTVELAHGGR